MKKILIVEDEEPINQLIKMNLTAVGYECEQAFDGEEAYHMIQERSYQLIIMDIMLPHISGFELMEGTKKVPVICLTAKSSITDKMEAFSLGAQDYIVKPFEILELIARVNIILRRNQTSENIYQLDDLKVDMDAHKVFLEGSLVELTPQEYGLLETLIINRNLALTREKLIELAWDVAYDGDSRTVDVHIQKIRKKLKLENRIKTVYKIGYRLEV